MSEEKSDGDKVLLEHLLDSNKVDFRENNIVIFNDILPVDNTGICRYCPVRDKAIYRETIRNESGSSEDFYFHLHCIREEVVKYKKSKP